MKRTLERERVACEPERSPAPDERRELERRAAQRAQDAEAEARLLKTVSRSGRRIARA